MVPRITAVRSNLNCYQIIQCDLSRVSQSVEMNFIDVRDGNLSIGGRSNGDDLLVVGPVDNLYDA
jgi:hypothetical protein